MKVVQSFIGHKAPVLSVFITSDLRHVDSGGEDTVIKVRLLSPLHLYNTSSPPLLPNSGVELQDGRSHSNLHCIHW